MNLLIIWSSFIIIVSRFKELNLLHYLLFNILIFWFTYFYHFFRPLSISSTTFILFFSIPSLIICYITFIYGNFLLITFIK